MSAPPTPAPGGGETVFIELNAAVDRLREAQSVIEAEARGAFGEDREELEDINSIIDDLIKRLEIIF